MLADFEASLKAPPTDHTLLKDEPEPPPSRITEPEGLLLTRTERQLICRNLDPPQETESRKVVNLSDAGANHQLFTADNRSTPEPSPSIPSISLPPIPHKRLRDETDSSPGLQSRPIKQQCLMLDNGEVYYKQNSQLSLTPSQHCRSQEDLEVTMQHPSSPSLDGLCYRNDGCPDTSHAIPQNISLASNKEPPSTSLAPTSVLHHNASPYPPARLLAPTGSHKENPTPRAVRFSELVRSSISNFRHLKGHDVPDPSNEVFQLDADNYLSGLESPPDSPRPTARMPVLDCLTLHLPPTWETRPTRHRYLASVGLIQKRGLSSALSSPLLGNIELIEHNSLKDISPDLVLDPQHAVIFVSLSQLPSVARELMERLKTLLPRYDNILTIFEAYAPSRSNSNIDRSNLLRKAKSSEKLQVDVFSPPVILALKRFRRELTIERELASGEDGELNSLEVVCALSPSEAAMYARIWGDIVEGECRERGVGPSLWGGRSWLEVEEDEVC